MKPLTIVLISVVIVVAIVGIILRVIDIRSDPKKPAAIVSTPEPAAPKIPVEISVIVAIPAEPWVSQAAELYNKEDHFVKATRIIVEVIPMDGLSALNKWANGEFKPVPTAWLAESRAWVDQANIGSLKRTGQDIFLAGGRYRAQPVILSPLVWGIWRDAYNTLVNYMGTKKISWDEIHQAAVVGRWADMGGEADRGEFKLVVAHPRRDPAGLTAMVSAAGEYFDKPVVSTKELQDPLFLDWLSELFNTVVDFSPFGVENMFLFGRSNGDAGQMVESYLLVNMEGLEKRWNQPLEILYPDPIAWFDFPYAIYMGKETTAEEKHAALDFKNYLLSANQQAAALEFGLRPASPESPSIGRGNGKYTQWVTDEGRFS
jgi:Ca-activated chloride channel family protein